ncbi:YesL family protein [Anaerosporobacter faecicola]|uniref:YesL family protein n=1 Tax=Anaerosporobacter faecicola TaxID=2718714 RepID=UPI00143B8763|nr:DUF624 domain-containing protein [Anaerosporobacter faecicola]
MKFNVNSPFFQFMNTLAEYILLNFLWLICCLPIVTIGASTTALYYVTMQTAREEHGYIARNFFRSFKENFKQSTIIWLIMLFLGAVLTFNVSFWFTMKSTIGNILGTLISIALLLFVFTLFYVFPILARFENTVKQTMKNALFISLQNLKQTILITITNVLMVVLAYVLPIFSIFLILFGFAFIAYINSFQFVKVFKYYEPDEETEGDSTEEFLDSSIYTDQEMK